MKILGITGGVGSGKSAVLKYLTMKNNVVVYEADKVAFDLQQQGTECYEKIVEHFGVDILLEDQSIDRKKLGTIVFSDENQLEILNNIVHPSVRHKIEHLIEFEKLRGTEVFVLEAAILLESNYQIICNEVWYIYCDRKVRIQRLQESRNYTTDTFDNISQKQLSEEEFRAKCDVTIDNSGDKDELYNNVELHLKKLLL